MHKPSPYKRAAAARITGDEWTLYERELDPPEYRNFKLSCRAEAARYFGWVIAEQRLTRSRATRTLPPEVAAWITLHIRDPRAAELIYGS